MAMRRVLVTGGTGVTGAALVRYLLLQNIEVIALIRPQSQRMAYLPEDSRLHIVPCGMDGYSEADGMLQKYLPFDVFFHLAWDGSRITDKTGSRDNMPLQVKNIAHTIEAAELCRRLGCGCFLLTGSQAEFGRKDQPVCETMESMPENGYGSAKLCAENMTRILCRKYGIRHICARLFSIYGPYDGTNSLIDTSIRKLLRGESPRYTQGLQKWDFLFSFDAAKALYLLAERGKDGEMYCVASGRSDCLSNYIRILHEVVCPADPPNLGALEYGNNPVMCLTADIAKLRGDTGFEPETPFSKGIEITKNWLIKTGEAYGGKTQYKRGEGYGGNKRRERLGFRDYNQL